MDTNQPFLHGDAQFQAGCMNGEVMVDPMLDPLSAPGGTSDAISPAEAHQFWINASIWNQSVGNQMSFLESTKVNGSGSDTCNVIQDTRQPSDTSTATSSTIRTRSSSPTSTRQTRKRSMTSSRSSVPSASSSSPDNNKKTAKVRQQPSRQRKQSEKMAPSTSRKEERVKQEPGVDEGDGKRNRFLERNRVAASKCRQKKKEWVSDLEETKHELENRNNSLQMEHNTLVLELTRMKNHLMTHATCNDPHIDQWIENEARKFVQNTAGLFGNIPPSGTGAEAGADGHRNRNGSFVRHSQTNVMGAHLSSPHSRDEEINFDHMPDGLFDDKPLE